MAQYIDKSALEAEIESKIKEWKFGSSSEAKYRLEVYKELSEWLNGIEVKEVDLDFETELYKRFGQIKDFTLGIRIAKHFYELGLKTKEDKL